MKRCCQYIYLVSHNGFTLTRILLDLELLDNVEEQFQDRKANGKLTKNLPDFMWPIPPRNFWLIFDQQNAAKIFRMGVGSSFCFASILKTKIPRSKIAPNCLLL
jgi:hypothetical protein